MSSASATDIAHASDLPQITTPATLHVGVYVVDFKRFNVEEGTVEAMFYLNIRSDSSVSISDLEFMNGRVSSVDVIRNTPFE